MLVYAVAMAAFRTSACELVTTTPAKLSNGVYCLAADVEVVSQPAFELGDDSVLDCRGHKVSLLLQPPYPDDFEPWAISIRGSNAVVRNCIVDGGYVGIHALGDYFRIQGNTIRNSTLYAIQTSGIGGGLVGENLIHPIAGVNAGDMIKSQDLVDIVGNVIFGADRGVDGLNGIWGISVDEARSRGSVIARNIIRSVRSSPSNYGASIRIVHGCPVIYRNLISAVPDGGTFSIVGQPDTCISALNTVVVHP